MNVRVMSVCLDEKEEVELRDLMDGCKLSDGSKTA